MSVSKNSFVSKSSGGVCTPTHSNSPTSGPSPGAVYDFLFTLKSQEMRAVTDRAQVEVKVMKGKTVSICCFTSGMQLYAVDAALVAIVVIRATTTATTAVSTGRKC